MERGRAGNQDDDETGCSLGSNGAVDDGKTMDEGKRADGRCPSLLLWYMTPNSCMLLQYTVDNGQRSLMELTAAYDGS
jgi:hypothetical protein